MSGLLPEPSRSYKRLMRSARRAQFTVEDTETNFVAVEEKKSNKLRIRGATLLKLVEKLTSEDCLRLQPEFQPAVLVTLPTFASPAFFLDMLVERYNVPNADDVGTAAHAGTFVPIQLRVLKLLKFWLEHFYHDFFVADVTLRDKVHAFLNERAIEEYVQAHVDALRRNLTDANSSSRFAAVPQDKLWPPVGTFEAELGVTDPHTISLAQFGSADVARQIALRFHRVAREVEWHMLNKHALEAFASQFGVSETDPLGIHAIRPAKRPAALPDDALAYADLYWELRRFIEDETLICVHAAADGVSQSDAVIARQHALIDLWCDVAVELLHMRCLPAAFAIGASLYGKLGKKTLKAAWKGIAKRKESGLQALAHLASPKKSYKELRSLKVANEGKTPFTVWPPAMAYWLLEVHTSAPDFLPGGLGDLIDIEKRERLADHLLRVRRQQQTPYPFTESAFLQNYFDLTVTQRRHGGGGAGEGEKTAPGSPALAAAHSSSSAPPSPALENRATQLANDTPSKRNSKLGGLVRSLTRSQTSRRRDSAHDEESLSAAASVASSSGDEEEPKARRRSGSLVGTLKRKNKAKAASALRAVSAEAGKEKEDDSSVDGEGGSDSDSGEDDEDDELDGASLHNLSPRLRRLRVIVRERAAADVAAEEASKQGLQAAFEAAGGEASDSIKKTLLTALKRSAAARRLILELLGAEPLPDAETDDEAYARVWSSPPPLMRPATLALDAANARARAALDLARAQAAHLGAFVLKPTRAARSDTASGSPPASPRRPRSASVELGQARFVYPPGGEKRARGRTDSLSKSLQQSQTDAVTRRPSLGEHRQRGPSAEDRAALALSPRALAAGQAQADSAVGALVSISPQGLPAPLSYSSASVSLQSLSSSASNSPRSNDGVFGRGASTLGSLPQFDGALLGALRGLFPCRGVRRAMLNDAEGNVCGWPAELPIVLLATEDAAPAPTEAAAETCTTPRAISAFRAIADGLRVENVVDTPLPLLVTPACDAAELAFFIRQCKFHSSIWRANQTEQGVTDDATPPTTTTTAAAEQSIHGVLAVQLIDDNLKEQALANGCFVIVH